MNENFLKNLNPEQKEAVISTEGPLLVVAGAGSGKTRVLTHRIAYIIKHCDVMAWQILALTFTNKAANEMKERIKELLDYSSSEIWAGTFHSICSRILRRHASLISYTNNFVVYDSQDQSSLIRICLKELKLTDKTIKINDFKSMISKIKNSLIKSSNIEESFPEIFNIEKYIKVFRLYERKLLENNAMDFDDLILKTLQLFRENKEVLELYRSQFRYIHVDEYQDTNLSQYKLISYLSSKHKNIMVVGDEDQSIYAWRGADIRNISEFEKDFNGAKVVILEQNYRSKKAILDLANSVIENNKKRKPKNLWTSNQGGSKPLFKRFKDAADEADFVYNQIQKLILNKGFDYKDFAILYRANAQSQEFELKFKSMKIPYKVVGGKKFYDRKEIKDIHAYLQILVNPSDTISFSRIINTPSRGIGSVTVDKIINSTHNNSKDLVEKAEFLAANGFFPSKRALSLISFCQMIKKAKDMISDHTLFDIMEYLLEASSYLPELLLEKNPEAQSRIENLITLLASVKKREDTEGKLDINLYLQEIALLSDQDSIDDENSVNLMTVHAAKGLEYPVVFMVGMEEKSFPNFMSIKENNIEEERRLCYVAITRAEEFLYLSAAKERFKFGKYEQNSVSRFVEEMDESCLDYKSDLSGIGYGNFGTKSKAQFGFSDLFLKKDEEKFQEFEHIEIGSKIRHSFFGKGTVIKIVDSSNMQMLIAFDNKGLKNIIYSQEQIKIL